MSVDTRLLEKVYPAGVHYCTQTHAQPFRQHVTRAIRISQQELFHNYAHIQRHHLLWGTNQEVRDSQGRHSVCAYWWIGPCGVTCTHRGCRHRVPRFMYASHGNPPKHQVRRHINSPMSEDILCVCTKWKTNFVTLWIYE